MTMLLLLIALAGVSCFTTLVGGVMVLIGFLKKQRSPKCLGAILTALSLLTLAVCFVSVSAKLAHKLRGVRPKEYLNAMVGAAFDDTKTHPLNLAEAQRILAGKLAPSTLPPGIEVQGVWVEGAVLSYGYFLYTSGKQELLNAIASAPIDPSFSLKSDTACREVTWDELRGGLLTYEKGPQRNLPGWNLDAVEDKRCYRCLRSPWSHELVIDAKSGKVFHAISEMRD